MSKNYLKKAFITFISFVMLMSVSSMFHFTASAISCRKDGFDKSRYTLSGNIANDVATIAKSQKGRTGAQFGYTEAWCDEFVADCLENAGADSSIVGHGGTVADFENVMRKKGAVPVSSPQTGDLVFFTYSHVEIVTKVENGVVYCAGGNNGGTGNYKTNNCAGERKLYATARLYLRPNYSGNPKIELVTPTITTDKGSYTVGDTVHISWAASPSNSNISHYWLQIDGPDGWYPYAGTMDLNTSYSFVASKAGDYTIKTYATPKGSKDGEGSLTDIKTISVKSIVEIGLNVSLRNSSVANEFSWKQVDGASHYNLRIWKDKLWDGDEYLTEWELKSTTDTVILPEGTYYAYVDACFPDGSVTMSNVVEFRIGKGTVLDVSLRNSSVANEFSWKQVDGASHYNLRIWKDKLWEGNDYLTEWGLESTTDAVTLPEGTYYAYVDTCFPDGSVTMSNVVEFRIGKGTALDVSLRNSSVANEFSWKQVDGASHYNLRIWKDKLWEGDDYLTDWELKSTTDAVILPVGTYYAYVDTCFPDGSVTMSNVVEFRIGKGTVLDASLGNSSVANKFSWKQVDGASHYNLRIWKDKLWEGDDYLTDWELKSTTDAVILPAGTYYAYVDTCFPDGSVTMSNVVKLDIKKIVQGDCNNDGEFSVSDIVFLQNWLLAKPDTKLVNWKAADLCEDNRIDVFDMIEMRKLIINSKSAQ